MNNIKCVEQSFYFGDIFADWKVTFRLIPDKFEYDITSFKLSMNYRGPVDHSENELTKELALKYLGDNYKRIHHLAGIRDKHVGYPITKELNTASSEYEEYMRGYTKDFTDEISSSKHY